MMKQERKYNNTDAIVEDYLERYDPRQTVYIGFNIPDAYRYAKSVKKQIGDLSKEELSQFATN